MWSAVIPATTWALLWLLLPLALFVRLTGSAQPPRLVRRIAAQPRPLLIVAALALLVRLVPMLLLPVGAAYDIESFRLVGEALLTGQDVYASATSGRHPYLPLQMYWIGAALWAAQHTAVPFVLWIKLPAVLADVAITAVLFRTAQRWGRMGETAVLLALVYALNPLPLLISAYHGQFDALTVLLLLLAWYAWHFGRRLGWSAVALALAVLSKTWPIVFLPIVLLRLPDWRRRLGFTGVVLAIPLLSVAVYLLLFTADAQPMLRRVLTHTGVAGFWGHSALLAAGGTATAVPYAALLAVRRWLLLLAGALGLWLTRRQSALDALLTLVLLELVVTVGIGIQWLVWPLPFAVLAGEVTWLRRYSLACLVLLLAQLYGLHLYPWAYTLLGQPTGLLLIRFASLPGWIVTVLWAYRRLRPHPLARQPG